MNHWRAAFGGCAGAWLVSCTLLTSFDGLTGGSPEGPSDAADEMGLDAAPAITDAPAASDAPDAIAAEASADAGASSVCVAGKSACGAACVDVTRDTNNCGACGVACTGGTVCVGASCVNGIYISPTGNDDAGAGTSTAPWRTFARAMPQLLPGNALILLDGTYSLATTGLPFLDCGATGNVASGTASAPIGIAANNERAAVLASDGTTSALSIANCNYVNVFGLTATSADNRGLLGNPNIVDVSHSGDVTLRNLLVARTNRYVLQDAMYVGYSSNVTVTAAEIYAFHNNALNVDTSTNVGVVRVYTHSRDWADIDGGVVTPTPTGGETGIWIAGSTGVVCTNCVDEDSANGIRVLGGTNNAVMGCASVGGIDGLQANDATSLAVTDTIALSCSGSGFLTSNVSSFSMQNVTAIGCATYGVALQNVSADAGLSVVVNALALASNDQGISANPGYIVDHANAFSNPNGDYAPIEAIGDDAGLIRNSLDVAPTLIGVAPGRCVVYVPPASNMKGVGADGGDIGANMIYVYEDGGATATKLWEVDGGFPCGAFVSGINDVPGTSCVDVNQRLRVGIDGCPTP